MKRDQLVEIWTKAVRLYAAGDHDPAAMFNEEERTFLEEQGITPHEVYDFAEDFADSGEPDVDIFVRIHEIRRAYFMEVQHGKRSGRVVDPDSLPERGAEAGGMPWLPRIIVKAKAKLRGELHPDIMYCCGGDRTFLGNHGIDPVDFLRAVWENDEDDAALVDWVRDHSRQLAESNPARA